MIPRQKSDEQERRKFCLESCLSLWYWANPLNTGLPLLRRAARRHGSIKVVIIQQPGALHAWVTSSVILEATMPAQPTHRGWGGALHRDRTNSTRSASLRDGGHSGVLRTLDTWQVCNRIVTAAPPSGQYRELRQKEGCGEVCAAWGGARGSVPGGLVSGKQTAQPPDGEKKVMVRSVHWATRESAEMGKAKAEQTELHRDERGRTHQIWSLVWHQVEVWCGQTHTRVFSLRGVWTSNAKKGATGISTRHGCGGSRHKGMIKDHGRSASSDLGDGHQEAREEQ